MKWTCLLFTGLFLCGCAGTDPQADFNRLNMEKEIAKQQFLQDSLTEVTKEEELTVDEYNEIGDRYLRQGNINHAFLHYSKALRLEPDNYSILFKMATLRLQKKMYVAAEQNFQRILAAEPENAKVLAALGQAQFGQKKLEPAEKAFKNSLELEPGLAKSHIFLGLIHSLRKEFDEAAVCFQKAAVLEPDNIDTLNNLAMTRYLQGRYEEAALILEEIIKKHGTVRKVYNNLGLVYSKLNKFDLAMKAFQQGAENDAAAYNNMGYELMLNQKYDDARKALEKAMALHPKYYEKAHQNIMLTEEAQASEH